ncbi:MAG: rod shape-determining protein RodA [Parcubacteria group bacterium]
MLTVAFDKFRHLDWILIAAVFLLFCLGLATLYSVGLSQPEGVSNFHKQMVFGVIGFICLFIIGASTYSAWRVYSRWLYAVTLFLLVLVLFFGSTINGTKGWFQIGGLGIQPVELAKISLLVFLAKFFSNRFQYFQPTKHLIVSLGLTFCFVFLIVLQPDLGSALVLVGIWLMLLILVGLPGRYWIGLMLVFIILATLGWTVFLHDYQKDRIMNFANPTRDPLGSGYNVTQSIIAIGSGHWFGKGLGFGSQSQLRFIPEAQTDFLFAVIAEELGLFGVAVVLALWLTVFYRLILIARRAADDFGQLLVLGVACLLFIHLIVNVGMNIGIMPVMGISLPFMSYGGSFVVVSLVLIGMAESVAVRR